MSHDVAHLWTCSHSRAETFATRSSYMTFIFMFMFRERMKKFWEDFATNFFLFPTGTEENFTAVKFLSIKFIARGFRAYRYQLQMHF